MTAQEIMVPYILEDFAPGDRVYRSNKNDGDLMGRIKSVSGKSVLVTMDSGEEKRVRISAFDPKPNRIWGKALDLDSLSVGDRISRRGLIHRTYATVLSFTPSKTITIQMELPRQSGTEYFIREYRNTPERSLDWHFARWEMEG